MPNLVLELLDVSLRYRAFAVTSRGTSAALDRCSLRIHSGECIGVVGEAGAGKTTLLLCASRVLNPDFGEVRGEAAEYVSRLGTAHPYIGVRAALDFACSLLELSGCPGMCDVEVVLRRTGLTQYQRVRIGQLAPALRARTSIAHALLAGPRILCLDDVLDPLDTTDKRNVGLLLAELCADGIAIVLSARSFASLAGVATRVYRVHRGCLSPAVPAAVTLELDVERPGRDALALANRIPSVRRRGRALRVPLERISAEEVLSTCLSLGITVQGSRVISAPRGRSRVAERSGIGVPLPSPPAIP